MPALPVPPLTVALLSAAAFVAGLVDAVVGGGGLIQAPALFLLLPTAPVPAVLGTNKLASIAGTSAAAATYARRVRVDWPVVLAAAAAAVVAAFLGARLATRVSRDAFRPFLLVALAAMGAYTLWRKDFGALARAGAHPAGARRLWVGAAVGAGVGFYDGIFGPGAGSLLVFLFVGLAGLDFLGASAGAKVVNTATNVAALSVFLTRGTVFYQLGIPMAACNLAGGVLGARLAVRRGSGFVRGLFLAVVVLLMARLAYDAWRSAG